MGGVGGEHEIQSAREPDPAVSRPPLQQRTLAAQALALQRTAGNRAVSRLAAASGTRTLARWGHTRELTASEKDLLRGVFGSALDVDVIRLNLESWLAIGATRTTWNQINIRGTTIDDDTLIHESAHCYQNQRGDHYMASSLAAQGWHGLRHWDRNRAYDYSDVLANHVSYDDWNSEQQAQWIENNRTLPPSRRGVAGGYP